MLLNYSLWCLWEYLGVACNKPKLWTRELDQFYLHQQQDVKKHKEKKNRGRSLPLKGSNPFSEKNFKDFSKTQIDFSTTPNFALNP